MPKKDKDDHSILAMACYNHWRDTLVPDTRSTIRGLLDPLTAMLLSLTCREEREQWRHECKERGRPLDANAHYLLGGFATPDCYDRWKPKGVLDMCIAGAAAREGNLTLLQHMPLVRGKIILNHLGMLALLHNQHAVRRWIKSVQKDDREYDMCAYALTKTANGYIFAAEDFIRAMQRYDERQRRREEKLAAIPQRRLELKAEEQESEQLRLTAREHDVLRCDFYRRREELRRKEETLQWGLQAPMPIHWRTMVRTNNVAALAFLLQHKEAEMTRAQTLDALLDEAIKTAQWPVLQWLLETPAPLGGPEGRVAALLDHRHRAILQCGNLLFCQWLHAYMLWDREDIEIAKDAGHEKLAQWLENLF